VTETKPSWHGDTIGTVVMGEAQIVAADPIILDAARVDSFDDSFAVVALAHASQLPTLELFLG
jgi:hypothetical protein